MKWATFASIAIDHHIARKSRLFCNLESNPGFISLRCNRDRWCIGLGVRSGNLGRLASLFSFHLHWIRLARYFYLTKTSMQNAIFTQCKPPGRQFGHVQAQMVEISGLSNTPARQVSTCQAWHEFWAQTRIAPLTWLRSSFFKFYFSDVSSQDKSC